MVRWLFVAMVVLAGCDKKAADKKAEPPPKAAPDAKADEGGDFGRDDDKATAAGGKAGPTEMDEETVEAVDQAELEMTVKELEADLLVVIDEIEAQTAALANAKTDAEKAKGKAQLEELNAVQAALTAQLAAAKP